MFPFRARSTLRITATRSLSAAAAPPYDAPNFLASLAALVATSVPIASWKPEARLEPPRSPEIRCDPLKSAEMHCLPGCDWQ